MKLSQCRRTEHFRALARRRLPAALFHYIDGGADDEVTLARNTAAFEDYDLVPNVLAGVRQVDLSTQVLGASLQMPFLFSPTAMQRLFHHDGEKAIAQAAETYGTMFGISTLATHSIEQVGAMGNAPKLFQIYVHNDKGLTEELIDRCKTAGFSALALTVDTVVSGNRERDYLYGMTTPPRFTVATLANFAMHPRWTLNYLLRPAFDLPNISSRISKGATEPSSIVDYINEQMRPEIHWDDAAHMIEYWGGPFVIKGVMSVADARRAVQVGASAIMLSNHGGRQLDGSRAPFDQLKAVVDAVGGEIEIILDGGVRRGTHVLKALALGASACSGGRAYLYPLAAGGTAGVMQASKLLRDEMRRDMMLMGCDSLAGLNREMLARRSSY